MMNRRAWLLAGTVATALPLSGGASTPATPRTVAEAIAAHPQLSTLNKLIHDNGLAATLNETGPFTMFAPTDDASKAASARTSESLKDKERVVALVKFHVVPGTMTSDEVRNGNAPTLNGATVALSKSGAPSSPWKTPSSRPQTCRQWRGSSGGPRAHPAAGEMTDRPAAPSRARR